MFCDIMNQSQSVLWNLHSYQRVQRVNWDYHISSDHLLEQANADDVVFQYTLTGELHCQTGAGQEHMVPPHHAYLFQNWSEARWVPEQSPPYSCMWVRFIGAGLCTHWAELRRRCGPTLAIPPRHEIIHTLNRTIDEHEAGASKFSVTAHIHSFVLQLFRHAESQGQTQLAPVQQAIQYILSQEANPQSICAIADQFGVTREHLTRVFSEQIGSTPATWLRQRAYLRARAMLIETNLSIAQIAESSGFTSPDAFARTVRERDQLTPSQLRASLLHSDRQAVSS